MDQQALLGWDFETHLMGAQRVAPPVVCLSAFYQEGDDPGQEMLYGRREDDQLSQLLGVIFDLTDTDTQRVAHNASFDLAVACAHDPSLMHAAFEMLLDERMHCTIVREKLLCLTQFGSPEFIEDDRGRTLKVDYSIAGLMMYYFGEDRSELKKGDDAWRMNYAELEDIPVDEWPEEAVTYAIGDSVDAVSIWKAQEIRRAQVIHETGVDPFVTLNFRCAADFALHLMTCWGLKVDAEEKQKIEDMIATALAPENLSHLIGSGVLRPGEAPKPYKNGAKDKNGNPKMTKGKKESINKALLQEIVKEVCEANGIEVRRTEKTKKFPEGQISTGAEVIDGLYHLSDVLSEYRDRQKLQKLVTTELPRMCMPDGSTAPVVHPSYDILKKTGRTSSFASKAFPSFNCQNVDPRVRNCFVPRDGFLLFSIDYNQMELGTLAQRCLDLFGHSTLAEKINAGYDLHSFLGAQIARHTHDQFSKLAPDDKDECYELFMQFKKSDDPEEWSFWKHYRTLAKPTGLGYPGGLGPETFVAYAKATYGVIIDLETAELLRDVWKATFDEMPEYFNYINRQCIDERFSEGRDRRYAYSTPFGMYRPNADYCAAANGLGLQSPSAEGAIWGVIQTVRACFDPTMRSILGDDSKGPTTRPICFIHDEQLGEVRDDDRVHDRVMEIVRIMVQSMKQVTPDVEARAEAALMRRWDKRAEPVYNEAGRLIPWEPKDEKE